MSYDSRHPEEYEYGQPFDLGPEDGEPEIDESEEDDLIRTALQAHAGQPDDLKSD